VSASFDVIEPVGTDRDRSTAGRRKFVGWLAIVLPAFLAGIFSLLPNVFDRFTSPEAALSYSLISSPSIQTPTGYSRIFSLTIENSGSARVTGVEATLAFVGGKIERMSIGDSAGDQPRIQTFDDGGHVSVRSMFPKERIEVVALSTSVNTANKPTISVRSDQTIGRLVPASDNLRDKKVTKWTAILAGLGALIASILGVIAIRAMKLSSAEFYLTTDNGRIRNHDDVVDRHEAIMFIADLVRNEPLTARLRELNYKVMYVQFADLLAEAAESVRGKQHSRVVAGLRSILLIPNLNGTTRPVVEDYLTKLGATMPLPRFDANSITNSLIFRDLVRRTFVEEGLDVPLSGVSSKGRVKKWISRWAD